jgi:hypothetical protein
MVADPAETGKFWFTQEYFQSTSNSNWKTRIASFSFANIMTVDATATPDLICHAGDTSQLSVLASGGSGTYSYSWSSVPPGFTSDIQNPLVSPTETTKYIVTVDDGTNTKIDSARVTLQPFPAVSAGNDTNYCWWVSMFPVSGSAENFSEIKWTTEGDGHFNFNFIPDPKYYPGDDDRANGFVTLNLTAYALEPCSDSITDDLLIDLVCTGVSQREKEQFNVKVQPNPSSGVFFVSTSGIRDQTVDLSIIDLTGKVVHKDAFISGPSNLIRKIDLSSLSKGTYILKLQTLKNQKIDKIVIQ